MNRHLVLTLAAFCLPSAAIAAFTAIGQVGHVRLLTANVALRSGAATAAVGRQNAASVRTRCRFIGIPSRKWVPTTGW